MKISFMHKWGASIVALLAAASLTTAGCAAEKPKATYDNASDLKDAFVKAGGSCDQWKQTNKVQIASQSGECGTSTVLSVYLSSDAVERRIEATKSSIFGSTGDDWLVGENWIVNSPDARQYQEKLGGRIVSFASR